VTKVDEEKIIKTDSIIDKKAKYLEEREKQKTIKHLEKNLEKLNKQQQDLHNYFLTHHSNYDPEIVKELEEIEKLINDKELEWLELAAE